VSPPPKEASVQLAQGNTQVSTDQRVSGDLQSIRQASAPTPTEASTLASIRSTQINPGGDKVTNIAQGQVKTEELSIASASTTQAPNVFGSRYNAEQQQWVPNATSNLRSQNEHMSEGIAPQKTSNQPNPQLAMLRDMTDAAAAGSRSYADSAPKTSKVGSPHVEGTSELLKPTASLLPNSTISSAMTTSESGHIRTAAQGMPTVPLNTGNLQDTGTPPTRAASEPQSLMAALEAAVAGHKVTPAPSTSAFIDGTASPSKLGLSPLQGSQSAEIPHGQIAEGIRGKGAHVSDAVASPGIQTTGMKLGDAGQSTGHSIGTDIRGGTTHALSDAHGIHAADIPTSSDARIGQAGGIPTSADMRGVDARVPQIPGQAIGNSAISAAPDARTGIHGNIPGAVGPGTLTGQHTQTGEHSVDEHTLHVPNLDLDDKTGHAGHKGKLHGVDQSNASGIDLVGLGAAAGAGAGLATLFDQVRHGKKESPEQGGKADAGGSSKAWTSKGRLKHQVQPGETLDEISRKYFQDNTAATLIVQINHAVLKPRFHKHKVVITLVADSIIDIPSPAEVAEFKKQLAAGTATTMNITYDSKSAHTERQPATDALGGKEECPTCGQTTFKGNACPRCSGNT
jgi:hypothetical protein